ncbi:LPS assembly lipoprotein LptE [Pseudomarimonas arenosa]|uniref:LPS-assembly lipoprotein LptE n=1 Tax=Pseudomarimonas arenosa TaxID=2774145 RepID=A0AAW3ZRW0_9GAMM|nr:LPS assembly lipoprotein LptE [Pseudomarimonas arenosa]MBD8526986.1 hypothetical protein [Pseudomarimonas arenosa]
MRFLVLAALSLGLAGCGFQLKKELSLPPSLVKLEVLSSDPYSPVQQGLERALRRAGAVVPGGEGSGQLELRNLRISSRPLSLANTGRVQEFSLEYRADVILTDGTGKVVLPLEPIVLERDYSFDSANPSGSPAEEELIRQELDQAMVDAVLRRLDVALRQ